MLSSSAESISHKWAKPTSEKYEKYFQHEKIKFVSSSGRVMFVYLIDTDEIPT